MKYMVALGIALVLNASANLMMKMGSNSIAREGDLLKSGIAGGLAAVAKSPILLVGLTCFALNAAFYVYALQSTRLTISIAYPIMVGGGYALIVIVAYLHPALAERLTLGQMAGVALILTGVIVLSVCSSDSTVSPTDAM